MQDSPILLPWYDQSDDRVHFSYRYGDTIAEPLIMAPYQKGDRVRPTFSLSVYETQELVDRLYVAGFVPTVVKQAPPPTVPVGEPSRDWEVSAINRHLEDMRKLVFEGLLPMVKTTTE